MRIAMGVEYDGTAYHGFQLQLDGLLPTVQHALQTALSKVANHPVAVVGAGRTDAGVHAVGQVIHFDTEAVRELRSWVLGANTYLPTDIAITWVKVVPDDFHARFSALRRRYEYIIYNTGIRSAILRNKVTCHRYPLQIEAMQEAARYFIGQHDFSSFRALACQAKTPVRMLYDLTIKRKNDFVVVSVEADAFLHHMVRNIVGVLLPIGEGLHPSAWAKGVLDARDRALGGITAPACGLYLHKIMYPEQFCLPGAEHFFEFLY